MNIKNSRSLKNNVICRFCITETESGFNIFDDVSCNVAIPETPLVSLMDIFKDLEFFFQRNGVTEEICFKCKSELELCYWFVERIKQSFYSLSKLSLVALPDVSPGDNDGHVHKSVTIPLNPPLNINKTLRSLLPKQPSLKENMSTIPIDVFKTKAKKPIFCYGCFECPRKYKSPLRLKEHEKTHEHSNICTYCDQLFLTAEDVQSHQQEIHKDTKFKCQSCKLSYSIKKLYYKHVTEVHKDVEIIFRCTICIQPDQNSFRSKVELIEHFEACHAFTQDDDLDMNEEFLDEFLLNHNDDGDNSFNFPECWDDLDLSLTDVLRLRTTDSTDLAYKCPSCFEDFPNQRNFFMHLAHVHDYKVLICSKCEMPFNRLSALNDHKSVHKITDKDSSFTNFQCKICDKVLKTASNLNYHIKTHSSCVKPHTCPYCEKEFQASRNLKQHLRIVHSNIKRHSCSLCDKRFVSLDHLKKHVLSLHHNERCHVCTVCSKRFSQQCHLKQHMEIHTTGKSFKCGICEKTFWKRVDWEKHLTKEHVVP